MQPTFTKNPRDLVEARLLCHKACQWPSVAARANLPAAADDSHSNLGWNSVLSAFLSHPLSSSPVTQIGFCFNTGALIWLVDERIEQTLALASCTIIEVREWVDQQLASANLLPLSHAQMPYDLSGEEDYTKFSELQEHCAELGNWYDYAQRLLYELVDHQNCAVNPVTVRCWPHHFDLGLLLMLDHGDPETARSIGMGFSPGDDNYDEPYFYCSPYPAPDLKDLEVPSEPLTWHTDGFVSLVVRGGKLASYDSPNIVLPEALALALAVGTRD